MWARLQWTRDFSAAERAQLADGSPPGGPRRGRRKRGAALEIGGVQLLVPIRRVDVANWQLRFLLGWGRPTRAGEGVFVPKSI